MSKGFLLKGSSILVPFIIQIIFLVPDKTIGNTVDVKLGKSTILICPYRSTTSPLLWFGPPKLAGYTNNAHINIHLDKHRRLKIIGDKENGQYNLEIQNSIQSDEGVYQCATVSSGKAVSFNFHLRVHRKPEILTNQHSNTIVILGKISKVSLLIDCFPSPSASWSQTAGAKLGLWNIGEMSPSKFGLTSTVLPTKSSHLGEYKVVVRNTEGRLEVKITLSVLEPSIHLSPATFCNTSHRFNLTCSIDINDNKTWQNEWNHFRNTVHIRSIKSTSTEKVSIFNVTYCDYQDEGEYICTWQNDEREISSSTSVIVYSMPVITTTDVGTKEGYLELSVFFYTNSLPIKIHWFCNDLPIVINTTSLLESANVSLLCYEKRVFTKGYRIYLLLNESYNDTDVISCQLQNGFGSAETLFDQELLSTYHQKVTAIYNETTRKNLMTTNLDRSSTEMNAKILSPQYLYLAIPGVIIAVLVIIMLIVIARNDRLIKTVRIERVGSNTRPRLSQSSQSDTGPNEAAIESHYDEIEKTSYQSVTWRTYDLHAEEPVTLSASIENESSKTIHHIYLDFLE